MGTTTVTPAAPRFDPRSDANVEPTLEDLVAPVAIVRVVQLTAGTETYAMTTPWRCRVIDAWCRADSNANSASNTVAVKNGSDAITDSMTPWLGTDKTVDRAVTIDNAYAVVAKGDTLAVTFTQNSTNSNIGEAYVMVQVLP